MEEGVTKYRCDWRHGPAPSAEALADLIRCRDALHQAGWIAAGNDGIGFGNISCRIRPVLGQPLENQRGGASSSTLAPQAPFVISGTQTAHIPRASAQDFTLVDQYSIGDNYVSCYGPVQASSEALTHASLYELSPDIAVVAHIHDGDLWSQQLGRLPTTQPNVPYGTPAMAHEMARLWQSDPFRELGVLVMGGHHGGLIAIGSTAAIALERLLAFRIDAARTP